MVATPATPAAPAPPAPVMVRRLRWVGPLARVAAVVARLHTITTAISVGRLTTPAVSTEIGSRNPAERMRTSATIAIHEPRAPRAQDATPGTRTILVAAHDAMLADLLQACLAHAGFAVLVAQDGRQACDLARQEHADLLVLDRQLPVVDGLEVCRMLRAESRVPIIIIAAHAMMDDPSVALDLGADDYLRRPFTPGELIARIRTILRRTSPQERAPSV